MLKTTSETINKGIRLRTLEVAYSTVYTSFPLGNCTANFTKDNAF